MSQRRMFSMKIVDTDAFLDMPQSSQLLYYSLAMRADDDGFISSPKKIMRILGSSEDDYKVLIIKKFIIPFESGVCVIKHWLIHNLIRGDRYTETQYIKEKSKLKVDEKTKKYSLNNDLQNVIPNDNQMDTQDRLGKDRLGKDIDTAETSSALIPIVIEKFIEINPACKSYYGNKTQRKACNDLIETYGFDEVINCVQNVLPRTNGQSYFPTITTPVQLRDKWISLKSAVSKKRGKTIEIIN